MLSSRDDSTKTSLESVPPFVVEGFYEGDKESIIKQIIEKHCDPTSKEEREILIHPVSYDIKPTLLKEYDRCKRLLDDEIRDEAAFRGEKTLFPLYGKKKCVYLVSSYWMTKCKIKLHFKQRKHFSSFVERKVGYIY